MEIDCDDLDEFSRNHEGFIELLKNIQSNTKRYISLFEKVALELLSELVPSISSNAVAQDVFDILVEQRKESLRVSSGPVSEEGTSSNPLTDITTDTLDIPSCLRQRFEVVIWSQKTQGQRRLQGLKPFIHSLCKPHMQLASSMKESLDTGCKRCVAI